MCLYIYVYVCSSFMQQKHGITDVERVQLDAQLQNGKIESEVVEIASSYLTLVLTTP